MTKQKSNPVQRRRRRPLRAAVQLPVLLWFVCPYLIATGVFQLERLPATAVAVVCAYLVFLVECVIVSMPMHWAGVLSRLTLTVLMAGVGAIGLDMTLYERDIARGVRDHEVVLLERRMQPELSRPESAVLRAGIDRDEARRRLNDEMQGTAGTKRFGCGPVCTKLERQLDDTDAALRKAQEELAS